MKTFEKKKVPMFHEIGVATFACDFAGCRTGMVCETDPDYPEGAAKPEGWAVMVVDRVPMYFCPAHTAQLLVLAQPQDVVKAG